MTSNMFNCYIVVSSLLKLTPFLSLCSILEVLAVCLCRLRAVPHLHPVPGWCAGDMKAETYSQNVHVLLDLICDLVSTPRTSTFKALI